MKKLIPLFFLILFACTKHAPVEVKKGRLYFVTVRSHSKNDTTYIDKPEHIASEEGFICRTSFCNIDPFCGQVTKYIKNPEAIDGTSVEYHTNDLGIIYSLNTTWKSYRRLHSTNDSIESRISQYIDHILSRSDLVIEGDIPLKYYDKIGPKIIIK
ncbi:MAG TPA: hypothetical protein PK289_06985 [Bacteroidia bacterium]|jgi:hypothetical protein|nr:hypothetical protein [Bacteroidia bacterium]HRG53070.1 hypothetical protein [Bacteroidia bacterium]